MSIAPDVTSAMQKENKIKFWRGESEGEKYKRSYGGAYGNV
jgi:hypothetical protein